ncbi:hypothetical protein NIES2104_65330 [Leptolyngbya sp. NIES-2104]|nr:hypothetical protein NIES2104_65330 [Leptolyngbya sp. NIES-2104]
MINEIKQSVEEFLQQSTSSVGNQFKSQLLTQDLEYILSHYSQN